MAGPRTYRFYGGIILAALIVSGCEFAGSTDGGFDNGNRNRTASAEFSTISGSNGTSASPAGVTVVLKSRGGFPLFNVTPQFSVTNPSANDFSFTCGATDSLGTAECSFRSFDVGVAKTLLLTSPISISGNAVSFTRAATQLTEELGPTAGNTVTLVNFAQQPLLTLKDPLGVTVTNDNDSVIFVTLSVLSQEDPTATASIFLEGTQCSANGCQVSPVSGIVNFASVVNRLSVDKTGTYQFQYSGSAIPTVTGGQFTITNDVAVTATFTTQPSTKSAALETFAVQPVVTIKDAQGNTITTNPGNNDNTAVVTLTLFSGTGTLIGTLTPAAVAGVADFSSNALRIDTVVGGTNFQIQSSTAITAGATVDTTNLFEITLTGLPSSLEFSVQPSINVTHDVLMPIQPKLRVLDSDGNLVTGDNSTVVTLSLSGTAGGLFKRCCSHPNSHSAQWYCYLYNRSN